MSELDIQHLKRWLGLNVVINIFISFLDLVQVYKIDPKFEHVSCLAEPAHFLQGLCLSALIWPSYFYKHLFVLLDECLDYALNDCHPSDHLVVGFICQIVLD